MKLRPLALALATLACSFTYSSGLPLTGGFEPIITQPPKPLSVAYVQIPQPMSVPPVQSKSESPVNDVVVVQEGKKPRTVLYEVTVRARQLPGPVLRSSYLDVYPVYVTRGERGEPVYRAGRGTRRAEIREEGTHRLRLTVDANTRGYFVARIRNPLGDVRTDTAPFDSRVQKDGTIRTEGTIPRSGGFEPIVVSPPPPPPPVGTMAATEIEFYLSVLGSGGGDPTVICSFHHLAGKTITPGVPPGLRRIQDIRVPFTVADILYRRPQPCRFELVRSGNEKGPVKLVVGLRMVGDAEPRLYYIIDIELQ